MQSPTAATRAVADGVCLEHKADPERCGAQRDVILYAAGAVLAVAGIAAGAVALGRWLRD